MTKVGTLQFPEARRLVIERVGGQLRGLTSETVELSAAAGRVLAEDIGADRDYPPVPRSVRDGFAVHSASFRGSARVVGEVRAGSEFSGAIQPGEAVEIMTGAPVPTGADAVIMVEHATRDGDTIVTQRPVKAGDFVNPRASEAALGQVLLAGGRPLGFAEIALLATVGRTTISVYRRPEVAILATGDELVPVSGQPLPHQVRNSNTASLVAQVERAGGIARPLPVAPDEFGRTSTLIEDGLTSDLLLLSGGVSAGKYDLVEKALAAAGAEFYFDRVLIQPGQPVVFGRARSRFFFGLPGNPASTMVTFEIFARAALELLGGRSEAPLPTVLARLTRDFRHKGGLTRFLPASLGEGATLTPIPWQGSSDIAALARANAWLVAEPDREYYREGDLIGVLLK